ncbi:retrovirus-related pol polyprotein from transposon TNT 1-94 [Tanacetum coccineum]
MLKCRRRRYVDDSRSSLSRPRPDAVARSLTPSLDRSRRRRFRPATSSPRSVNNTSLWIWCRIKHEAFGKFKEWKQLVENQTGRTVKKLRTDNGLEFCNRKFEQLCIESGIARNLTVVETP